MTPFQKAYGMVISLIIIILGGNCAYVSEPSPKLVRTADPIFPANSVGYQFLVS
jgi:hypothetical protein